MSMPSSPGKMDLSALSGLKRRVLQPVPSSGPDELNPVEQVPGGTPEPAFEATETAVVSAPATESPIGTGLHGARVAQAPTGKQRGPEPKPAADASVQLDDQTIDKRVDQSEPIVMSPEKIEPAEEEHSGHVTLYLPKDLNQWLGEHHDRTDISYPGIVLNAISWAAGENRFSEIFAPKDSPIPANDIFGRAPVIPKLARGSVEPETRPLRFRRDHMKVIISLARTWTADNRNAFFVGVLTAYRRQQDSE